VAALTLISNFQSLPRNLRDFGGLAGDGDCDSRVLHLATAEAEMGMANNEDLLVLMAELFEATSGQAGRLSHVMMPPLVMKNTQRRIDHLISSREVRSWVKVRRR
jgi:hypothetical protein